MRMIQLMVSATLLLVTAAQAQNLVTNGDFEILHNTRTGALLTTDTNNYRITSIGYKDPPPVDGWKSTSSISLLVGAGHGDDPKRKAIDPTSGTAWDFRLAGPANGYNNGLADASPVGGNYIALDGTDGAQGDMIQTVNGFIIGQSYKLSFWWGAATLNTAYENYDSSIGWNVSLKGTGLPADVTESLRTGAYQKAGPQPAWTEAVYTFTASATSEVLTFSTKGFATGHPPMALLDGVTITAVPEPGAWLLMAGGLAGLALLRRRSRQRD